jgi:hypothetical protein
VVVDGAGAGLGVVAVGPGFGVVRMGSGEGDGGGAGLLAVGGCAAALVGWLVTADAVAEGVATDVAGGTEAT